MKETEIAKPLIRWLEAQLWDVYQEVQIEWGGRIADIVGVRKGIVWVLELKTSLTASVVEQALYWRYNSHYASVVTPPRYRGAKGRWVLEDYMRWKGLGWAVASSDTCGGKRYHDNVTEHIAPKLHRKAHVERLRESLDEAHKTFAEAGSSNGKRWTPFQATAKEVRRLVKENPGCTLKFLVENCKHHYATAASFKSAIPKYIMSEVIDGVVADYQGRKLVFYPEEKSASD